MKKNCIWAVVIIGLLICVSIVLAAMVFPSVFRIPRWLWRRSHIPAMPTLTSHIVPTVSPLYAYTVLTPGNLATTTELAHFAPTTETAGPVAALALTSDGQSLLAAYAQEGVVRHWHLESGTLMETFDVSPISVAATDFDMDGRLLVAAAGQTPRAEAAGYVANIRGSRLWNAQTGELIWEIDSTPDIDNMISGVALSPSGQWLAQVEPQSLDVFGTLGQNSVLRLSLGGTEDPFRDRWIGTTPDIVAFDDSGEIVAWADREGRIEFLQRDLALDSFVSMEPPRRIDWAKNNDYTQPLALAFDRSRSWLAIVRSEKFELWSLGGKYIHRVFSDDISTGPTSDVAFSPVSDLVAVGTSEGWLIWDVKQENRLAQGGDASTFALTFSADGRLFICGDENGIIHIWGVPMP